MDNRPLYISYAWGGESGELVSMLLELFQRHGITYMLDKEQISPRRRITKFMDEIGASENTLVVLSDKYLRSEFCMYELNQVYCGSGLNDDLFLERTFFLMIGNLDIYYSGGKQQYISDWIEKVKVLQPATKSWARLNDIHGNYDSIISAISSLNISPVEISEEKLERVSHDIVKWMCKVEEPNMSLVKRILEVGGDKQELVSLNSRYPESNLLSLLDVSLLFREGFDGMNQNLSNQIWINLSRVLRGRDHLVYKTAFCLKMILSIEYYDKWRITLPDNDMNYRLQKGESDLMPEFLFGINLSKRSHDSVRRIHERY